MSIIQKEVTTIAWTIEGFIILVGLITSCVITFFEKNISLAIAIPGLLFFCCISIAELAKIPLAKLFVSSSLLIKPFALSILLILCFLTAETLSISGDLIQSARLKPILDITEELRLSENNVEQINDDIERLESLPVDSDLLRVDENIKKINLLETKMNSAKDSISLLIKNNNSASLSSLDLNISNEEAALESIQDQKKELSRVHKDNLDSIYQQKNHELDNSFLKGSIRKEFSARVDALEIKFISESKNLDNLIVESKAKLSDLYNKRTQASKITPSTAKQIEAVENEVLALKAQMEALMLKNDNLVAKSLADSDATGKKIHKLTEDRDIELANFNRLNSELDVAKDNHFIFRLAGYWFKKDAHDVDDDEYSIFNAIFIYSIAFGLSILAPALAALSLTLNLDKQTSRSWSKNIEEFMSFANKVKSSIATKQNRNDSIKLTKMFDENNKLRSKLSESETDKNHLIHKCRKLEKEVLKKPSEKVIEKIVYQPEFIEVPVPSLPQENKFGDFLNKLRSFKKDQPNNRKGSTNEEEQ